MQKKRKAQEAFIEQKPRLSAFAAAKAKAAQVNVESSSSNDGKTIITDRKAQNIVTEDSTSLPTLLSSFPLSGAHSAAYENGNDDNNDAGYSSEDQVWADISEAKSYRVAQPRQLSTFRPSKTNVLSDVPERLVLKLRADETVTFIGEYNLHVISGIIVIYGAAIRAGDKPHLVFAPSTHALPALTAKGGAAEIAIVSTGLSMVGMNKLSPLWGRIWNARDAKDGDHSDDTGNRRSFMLLRSSSNDPLKRALSAVEMDQDIQSALFRIMSPPIIMPAQRAPMVLISGPKGSGKSTVSRWLANTYLTSLSNNSAPSNSATQPKTIFWLDLDPGQPEFTAPGQVSLLDLRAPILGPPLTHASASPYHSSHRLIRSHTLASVSPKEDSDHFIACAFDLLTHYHRLRINSLSAPLIINCSGWVLGSAVEVLMALVRGFALSDVVLMSPMDYSVIQTIQDVLSSQRQHGKVLVIPQRENRNVQSRTSAESRAMMAMSYFHSCPPISSVSSPHESASGLSSGKAAAEIEMLSTEAKWDTRPLRMHRPWHVKYAGPNQGILALASYGEIVDPEFLSTVIDGMVLAICVIEDDAALAAPYPTQHLLSSENTDALNGEDSEPQDLQEPESQSRLNHAVARTPDGLPYLLPDRSSGVLAPLAPVYSRCLGLALVRGIDTANSKLQLLTPVSAAEIEEACCNDHTDDDDEDGDKDERKGDDTTKSKVVLVRGKFDVPGWALLEDLYAGVETGDGGKRPYVSVRRPVEGGAGLGGNVWRVRHLPRKMGGPDGGGGGGGA